MGPSYALLATALKRLNTKRPRDRSLGTQFLWVHVDFYDFMGILIRQPHCPPLALAETDDGPSRGPFSFWFQRGLVVATALRRLSKRSKSVSEPHLSLIDRPRSAEGRFQNSI